MRFLKLEEYQSEINTCMRLDEITKNQFKDKLKFGNHYIAYVGNHADSEALRYSGYDDATEFEQGIERAIPVEYSVFLAAVGGLKPKLASILDVEYSRDLNTGTYMLYDRISDVYHLFATMRK